MLAPVNCSTSSSSMPTMSAGRLKRKRKGEKKGERIKLEKEGKKRVLKNEQSSTPYISSFINFTGGGKKRKKRKE